MLCHPLAPLLPPFSPIYLHLCVLRVHALLTPSPSTLPLISHRHPVAHAPFTYPPSHRSAWRPATPAGTGTVRPCSLFVLCATPRPNAKSCRATPSRPLFSVAHFSAASSASFSSSAGANFTLRIRHVCALKICDCVGRTKLEIVLPTFKRWGSRAFEHTQ